jgi:hypothetical protein
MPISDSQYQAWLDNDKNRRVILVEIDWYDITSPGIETSYASNTGYISSPTDGNISYDPILEQYPVFTTSLKLPNPANGDITLETESGWGELSVSNVNGDLDEWIDRPFLGHQIRIYRGDETWGLSDFRLVFSGICIDASFDETTISFTMRGKDEYLNAQIQPDEITTGPDVGHKIPLSFGEIFNAKPPLISNANHRYQGHDGQLNDFPDIRDNGASLTGGSAPTENHNNGTFDLVAQPVGTVTCDIKGAAPSAVYTANAAEIAKLIITDYTEFPSADIDATSFTALAALCTQTTGVFVADGDNASSVISFILSSVGAYYYIDRTGKIKVRRLELPGTSPVIEVNDWDIEESSFRVEEIIEPSWKITVGYKKNYSPQSEDSLAGSLNEDQKGLYAQEWRQVSAEDTAIKTAFPLSPDAKVVETALQDQTQASAEASRLLTLWGERRVIYSLKCSISSSTVNLGDTIKIFTERFGFDAGKNAVIISLTESLTTNVLELKVIA